jgi:hypothetical protein
MPSVITKSALCAAIAISVGSLPALAYGEDSSSAGARVSVSAGDRQAPPGFKVSFNSIGSGINGQALKALLKLVRAEIESENLREYTLDTWGREGERTVCFVLGTPGSAFTLLQKFQSLRVVRGDERFGYESTASCKD